MPVGGLFLTGLFEVGKPRQVVLFSELGSQTVEEEKEPRISIHCLFFLTTVQHSQVLRVPALIPTIVEL